jgi:hypothetical protein
MKKPVWGTAPACVGPRPLGLVQRAQAASADVDSLGCFTFVNGHALNVGQPPPLCSLLRVAHIVAELGPFTTDLASYRH